MASFLLLWCPRSSTRTPPLASPLLPPRLPLHRLYYHPTCIGPTARPTCLRFFSDRPVATCLGLRPGLSLLSPLPPLGPGFLSLCARHTRPQLYSPAFHIPGELLAMFAQTHSDWFDRCRSFLRITPDFLIAYLIHSSPTSVHTPWHILSLSPWIPPRAIVHSKSVSALEPSVVYHSLYGQRQIRLIHDPRFLITIADS